MRIIRGSLSSDSVWNLNCACRYSTVFTTWRRTICPFHHVSTGRREPQPSVPAFSCAWRSTLPFQWHAQPATVLAASPLLDRQRKLAAGTTTQLSTIILVPAWTKNWTVCHSWLFYCKSGRTLTLSIHHHHHIIIIISRAENLQYIWNGVACRTSFLLIINWSVGWKNRTTVKFVMLGKRGKQYGTKLHNSQ